MAYTRVNWVDSPSTSTPINAANLNVMDAAISSLDSGKMDKSGGTFTGAATIALALSGSDKTFLTLNATDGKRYDLKITTGGAFQIVNVTDSIVVLELGPASGTIKAGGSTVWHAGNDGAGSGLDADKIKGHALFIQATDPGGSAATGDGWIKDA